MRRITTIRLDEQDDIRLERIKDALAVDSKTAAIRYAIRYVKIPQAK